MEWIIWKNYPKDSSRQNPIWVYSSRYKSITLGYSNGSAYFDMNGDGIPCFMWCKLTIPEPPKN